jgi:DNA-binding NarL/FixJ family response regulator
MRRQPTTLVHIDYDRAGAEFLRREIENWSEVQHVGAAHDGAAGLELCLAERPTFVLFEFFMQERCGIGILEQLMDLKPQPRVIAYTWLITDLALNVMASPYVQGVVMKGPDSAAELRMALACLESSSTYCAPEVRRLIAESRARSDAIHKVISPREQELLPFFGRPMSNIQVGERVGLSASTVHIHRQNIMAKLGLHNARDLCLYAIASGFSPPPLRDNGWSICSESARVRPTVSAA